MFEHCYVDHNRIVLCLIFVTHVFSKMPVHPGGLVSVEIPTITVTIDYNGFENWIDWVVATSM